MDRALVIHASNPSNWEVETEACKFRVVLCCALSLEAEVSYLKPYF